MVYFVLFVGAGSSLKRKLVQHVFVCFNLVLDIINLVVVAFLCSPLILDKVPHKPPSFIRIL